MDIIYCNKCNTNQPVYLFYKNKRYKYGYSPICKPCMNIRAAIWREKNRACYNEKARIYNNLWYAKNHAIASIKRKLYKQEYRKIPINKKTINQYGKNRRLVDALYKLKGALRNRICYAFKNNDKNKNIKSEELLGCTFEIAKKHLERQFKNKMTWENHGQGIDRWEIDHKIPLAMAKTKNELIELCHYTNLQPLWSLENNKKKDKILPIQTTLIL